MVKAIDAAKWFVKNNFDSPRDKFDGNMKLQKLLFFAQLIHVANYGKLLFEEDMRAFKNGTVINDVRLTYKNSLSQLIDQANNLIVFENEEVNQTLQLTADIFGNMTANELSDLNHELDSWKIPFNESVTNNPNVYDTRKNLIVPFNKVFMDDVDRMKSMLEAYEGQNSKMLSEEINGVTFYYDPSEIKLTEDILLDLESHELPDSTYSLTYDEQQGVIIY